MKRNQSTILHRAALTLLMAFMTAAAWAETINGTVTGCSLTWSYDTESETLTIGGTGAMVDYKSSDTQPWLKEQWDYRNGIKYLVIGKGVTTIGTYSFDNLKNLLKVTFDDESQLTSIGNNAFLHCNQLATITLPNSLTSIGIQAFYDCAMTSITIPASVTTIESNAFARSKLATITFAEGSQLTTIGGYAFQYTKLSSITIPEGVTMLGGGAFFGCTNLSSVTLPTTITSINGTTFSECTNLKSITIPASVTNIYDGAFKSCSNLTDVTINAESPATLTIGNDVFGSGVTIHVLYADTWSAVYPSFIFSGKSSTNTWTSGDTDVRLYDDGTVTVCKKSGDGNGAMADYASGGDRPWNDNRSAFKKVFILTGVTTIGKAAFEHCQNLTSADISASVTSIKEGAFYDCNSLISANIPEGVTSIGTIAFMRCSSLASVNLPASLISIGDAAFESCGSLTSITVASGNTVYDSRDNCNAIIETNRKKLIRGCKNTIIPATVTEIGALAFDRCGGLTNITIPNSVTVISFSAFANTGLTSVNIPASVTSIDVSAFESCGSLTSITVASGNTVYDSRDNCNAIIKTNSKVLIIGCKNTIIPATVTEIGENAFNECSGLTSITIPASVTTIGNYAFNNCSSLTSATIAGNPKIGEDAFPIATTVTLNLTANAVGEDYWMTFYNDRYNFQADNTTTVYKAMVSGSDMILTPVEDRIVNAGTAVILKSTGNPVMTRTSSDSHDGNSNVLSGTMEEMATPANCYTLATGSSGVGFYHYTGTTLAPGKAYYQGDAGARTFFGFDGETTAMEDVRWKMDDVRSKMEEGRGDWYTLDGRKLQGEPSQKGVYVRDGQKFIIK